MRVGGSPSAVEGFLARLESDPPPLARIDEIEARVFCGGLPYQFRIADSLFGTAHTQVAPDAAICAACAPEIVNEGVVASSVEFDPGSYWGLTKLLTIRRTEAQRRNARPSRLRHSQSLAKRRHRLSHDGSFDDPAFGQHHEFPISDSPDDLRVDVAADSGRSVLEFGPWSPLSARVSPGRETRRTADAYYTRHRRGPGCRPHGVFMACSSRPCEALNSGHGAPRL